MLRSARAAPPSREFPPVALRAAGVRFLRLWVLRPRLGLRIRRPAARMGSRQAARGLDPRGRGQTAGGRNGELQVPRWTMAPDPVVVAAGATAAPEQAANPPTGRIAYTRFQDDSLVIYTADAFFRTD